ncbi:hypothetical protein FPQ18DRAFT_55848 [Pyronema domesticum]|nr:hypothetical protein FPQ18DRAFT_55848 [Pyronema domesticum]
MPMISDRITGQQIYLQKSESNLCVEVVWLQLEACSCSIHALNIGAQPKLTIGPCEPYAIPCMWRVKQTFCLCYFTFSHLFPFDFVRIFDFTSFCPSMFLLDYRRLLHGIFIRTVIGALSLHCHRHRNCNTTLGVYKTILGGIDSAAIEDPFKAVKPSVLGCSQLQNTGFIESRAPITTGVNARIWIRQQKLRPHSEASEWSDHNSSCFCCGD